MDLTTFEHILYAITSNNQQSFKDPIVLISEIIGKDIDVDAPQL